MRGLGIGWNRESRSITVFALVAALAILGVPLVEALRTPGMREVMDAAGAEALDAALRLGNRIVPMFGQEGIEDTPPERYAASLQDWIKKWLGGSAPVNARLMELARQIEAGELEPGPANAALLTPLVAD